MERGKRNKRRPANGEQLNKGGSRSAVAEGFLYDLLTFRRSVGVSVATEIRLASGWRFVTLKVSLFLRGSGKSASSTGSLGV